MSGGTKQYTLASNLSHDWSSCLYKVAFVFILPFVLTIRSHPIKKRQKKNDILPSTVHPAHCLAKPALFSSFFLVKVALQPDSAN